MRRGSLWVCVLAALAVGCGADDKPKRDGFATTNNPGDSKRPKFAEDRDPKGKPEVKDVGVKFDGEKAVAHVKELCDLGPRVSGSDGMTKQLAIITKHFEGCGATVSKQEFEGKQKSQKAGVPMTNLIASWHPDRTKRVIFCAHHDTRPQADQEADKLSWNKPFVSANDGTSGVGFLMELARHMKDLPVAVGVDFVLFDGEEWVFNGPDGGDDYFLGSRHFADQYKKAEKTRKHTYIAAVLFDLFAHEDAKLKVEGYSLLGAEPLVLDVWETANKLKAKTFVFERGFKRFGGIDRVQDDHLPLLGVGIPAIDVIDFDYPHWHKLTDTPDKLSPKQMETVAKVMTTWLCSVKDK